MAYFRLPSIRSVARFLEDHTEFAQACGCSTTVPSYRTLTRRLKTLPSVLVPIAYHVVNVLVKYNVVSLRMVSTDSSLLEAKGIVAHNNHPEIIPTDRDAKWGWSESRSFVFGYKLHLTSTVLLKGKTVLPLAWEVTSANRHDSKFLIPLLSTVYRLASQLNRRIIYALGDKGYDHNKNYIWCNSRALHLITPVRRFKKHAISAVKLWTKRFVDTLKGKLLYRRRADNERLFSQMKDVFLIDPLPVVGKDNVTAYLGVITVSYMLGVLYNHLNGRSLRAIKSIAT